MQGISPINTDPLFSLIKSLNATEKAYFKKFVYGNENSNYLKLFDALNGAEVYSEEKILKKFKGEKFTRNLAVSKNYLFETILDSLRSYHRSKSVALKAENMLGNLRILYEKGLTEIFEKQLVKAQEFALENELTYHYLETLELERPHNFSKTKSNLRIQQKLEEQLLQIKNRHAISVVNEKILNWIYANEKAKNESEKAELDELMKAPVCAEPVSNFNFSGKNSFFSSWSFYYYAVGDFEKCIEQKEFQFQNYMNHPVLKKSNEKYFLLVMGNLLSMCYTCGNRGKFLKYFEILKEEHSVAKENDFLVEEQFLAISLLKFKLLEQYREGSEFVSVNEERIINGFEKFSLIRQIDICFNASIFHFKIKDFRQSLKWINRVLQNKNLDDREFMHCYARIVQLIIHFELKNTELLNSLLKSTYRYLFKRNRIHDFENIMLHSMQMLIKEGGEAASLKVFSEMKTRLGEIASDSFKKHSMDHFDYLGWLNEKLSTSSHQTGFTR